MENGIISPQLFILRLADKHKNFPSSKLRMTKLRMLKTKR